MTATGTVTTTLRSGLARLELPRFGSPGLQRVQVAYSGDEATAPSTQQVSIWVLR